ncbi:MAG: ATPase, T2SS/T4P/T4SS family [Thaumarchaeota archaeon]|nr:ATPase, T2SS/T4P/T4SS family [Nitrososphaerota archaeon]
MEGPISALIRRMAGRRNPSPRVQPLLLELFQEVEGDELERYSIPPFTYTLKRMDGRVNYQVIPEVSVGELARLRETVAEMSATLRPSTVAPLTFTTLIEVLCQAGIGRLASIRDTDRVRALSRLAAFEAAGIPTIYSLSLDDSVSEFYVDAPGSSVYLDHAKYGRCETQLILTERERKAVETHMDTFKGYTIDFSNPSLKNEFDIFGKRLRISLDLAPLAVSAFSLDVRKLTSSELTIIDLVRTDVLSAEAASFLLAALELGMNVTIVGETGTGKTTLLNALDEAMNPRLRRIYVEDAVETKDLLERGYHQMKLKVDPFDRGPQNSRTKSAEITKILHRSPDVVILGEIQSEEHSRAFFHALSAGIRGLQTFHASSATQAVRRWREMHGISKTNVLDLDILVQMARPERLGSKRQVYGISLIVEEEGEARLRELYSRVRDARLQRIVSWERLQIRKASVTREQILERLERIQAGIEDGSIRVSH